ncbi:MAG: DeoR/GlpR family DNA-binding transcription regulator [Lachnospiraceae bacterium]|nr:DeoR/GlpR family DNA-binding transcription regulator [Lachnospiraceae bacterium]
MNQRHGKILEILSRQDKADVTELSELLSVSQVTIRKDLDALALTGIIKREHGFAVLSDTNNIQGRLAYHYEEKRKIAEAAAGLVSDGDTVMIENGSCCAILAETLAVSKKDLTLITNSVFIAEYIRKKASVEIILLGGIFQKDSEVMVGPMVRQCVENFWVDHFFIGIDGYSTKTGFTNKDQLRAQAVRDMAHQADHIIVLTESQKFLTHGTVPINVDDQISMLITDAAIPAVSERELVEKSIQVVKI